MQVTILQNIYWKELGLLVFVWVSYLAVQIAKVFFPFLSKIIVSYHISPYNKLKVVISLATELYSPMFNNFLGIKLVAGIHVLLVQLILISDFISYPV
jgi:hypothetical protein